MPQNEKQSPKKTDSHLGQNRNPTKYLLQILQEIGSPSSALKKENIFVYVIENIFWYDWKYFFIWLKLFVASQRKIAESQRTNLISRSNPVTCFVGKDKDTLHDIHKDRSSSFIWNRENICWRNGATIKWKKKLIHLNIRKT